MNQPLKHPLERSGAAIHEYWPGTIPPAPPKQVRVVVSPSASITRAPYDYDAAIIDIIVKDYYLLATSRLHEVANNEAMRSLVPPKKVSRLQVITHQRGKGAFLPYD